MSRRTSPIPSDAQDLIDRIRLGYVATVCEDGTPNLSPKGSLMLLDPWTLAFAHFHSEGTIGNLRTRPAVEINVVDPIARKGYRFKGAGRVVEQSPEIDEVERIYAARRPLRFEDVKAYVLIAVHSCSPVLSPAYDHTDDQDKVEAQWLALYGLRRTEPND